MNNTSSIVKDNQNTSDYITVNTDYLINAFFKLLLSSAMSFLIGFERELHTHPGGICTHTLVGYGSCLFTMISVNLRDKYPSSPNADPARICAQIVSGMGFLGSATVFRSNNYVKGINTAANLWISAAISMAIGADLWELAIITCGFVIPVLFINNVYKKYRYSKNKKNINSNINQSDDENALPRDALDAPYGDENEEKID